MLNLERILEKKGEVFVDIVNRTETSLYIMKNITEDTIANKDLREESETKLAFALLLDKIPKTSQMLVNKDMEFSSKLYTGIGKIKEASSYLDSLRSMLPVVLKEEVQDFGVKCDLILYDDKENPVYIDKAKKWLGENPSKKSREDIRRKLEYRKNHIDLAKYETPEETLKKFSEISEDLRGIRIKKRGPNNLREGMRPLMREFKDEINFKSRKGKITRSLITTTGYIRGRIRSIADEIAMEVGKASGMRENEIRKAIKNPRSVLEEAPTDLYT